jgi:hypothetical protein
MQGDSECSTGVKPCLLGSTKKNRVQERFQLVQMHCNNIWDLGWFYWKISWSLMKGWSGMLCLLPYSSTNDCFVSQKLERLFQTSIHLLVFFSSFGISWSHYWSVIFSEFHSLVFTRCCHVRFNLATEIFATMPRSWRWHMMILPTWLRTEMMLS